MKNILKAFLRFLLPTGPVLAVNRGLRALGAAGHRLQFNLQWRVAKRTPAWFDHFITSHWQWHESQNPSSWQRGILGLFAMKPGCRALELCCGGGFHSYHFYAGRASQLIAVDFDQDAIRHARANFRAPNLEFRQANILTEMPDGPFDNICWDAGIEYFTEAETESLLRAIKTRLAPGGILSGCGIVARGEAASHIDHKHEFSSPEELAQLLRRFFDTVTVIGTHQSDKFLERATFHFFASDGEVPFGMQDSNIIRLGHR